MLNDTYLAKTDKDLVPIESLFGTAGLAFDHL